MDDQALLQAYEPNSLLAYVYRRFFEHITIDASWASAARDAATRGSVVYVLRNLSFLDFLALDHLTKRYGLPPIRFANDLGLWVLEPMGKGWLHALTPSSRTAAPHELAQALEGGGSAALFLKRPPSLLEVAGGRSGPRRGMREGDDLVRALLVLQRKSSRPILLIPQVFVWSKGPETRGGFLDGLLGSREWPGKVRTTLQFLMNYKNVVLRAGEPVDLSEFLRSNQGMNGASDDEALVRRLTYSLLRKVERERHAIVGPVRKPNDRVRDELVRGLKLQSTIRDLAGEGEKERMVLALRAYGMIRELEAQLEPGVIRTFEMALDTVINRIYDGIEVDQDGLDRVREAAKRGTLVLLPSHKSHVDYLILSFVFYHANLQLPLIAAGDNLSFFPLGPIFRRSGAFFIRRSFRGDRLYAAVVDAYIRRLIRDGFSIEFFLEGGRSRTGKLLPPKVGLLNMVVDSALSVTGRETFFVPVSIGYDRIVEGSAIVQELAGGEKAKEDARGLLRATKVLRGRYGRLNIQFGEILSLGAARTGEGQAEPSQRAPSGDNLSPAKRRAMVTRLAHRVMAEINRVTAVTPGSVVATALLNPQRRGVSHGELLETSARLLKVLKGLGARISKSLLTASGELREEAITYAARLFMDADMIQTTVPGESGSSAARARAKIYTGPDVFYVVPDEKRLALDMSKNIIVHFFVPRALVATAFLVPPQFDTGATSGAVLDAGGVVARATLEERVRNLSRLFKYEFMFRADQSFEDNFAETVAEMARAGELRITGDGAIALGAGHDGLDAGGWARFYASLVRTFLEGYRVAARGLSALLKGPLTQKDLVKRSMGMGERMFLHGEIQRREALSSRLVENALLAFGDQGYVNQVQGKLMLAESFAAAPAVRAIEGRIAGYWGAAVSPP